MAKRPKKIADEPSALLSATKFLALASRAEGQPYETHMGILSTYATSFNGLVSAGVPIKTNLFAAPNTMQFLNALAKIGNDISITALDNNTLAVQTSKARFVIPCVAMDMLSHQQPDAAAAQIDDRFRLALETCNVCTVDNGAPYAGAVYLNGQSCVGTDGKVIIQIAHGLNLPTGKLLPKASVDIFIKAQKKFTHLGYSERTATIWYDDGSWLKTQLYDTKYPPIEKVFDAQPNLARLPKDFYKALAIVEPFSQDGAVRFFMDKLASHSTIGVGATYDVNSLPAANNLSIKYLKMVEPYIKKVDFVGVNNVSYFVGDIENMPVWGAISSVR